ncbi:MAG: PEP-CTERM sorting domain-containing protein [Planctomycetota bacterium]
MKAQSILFSSSACLVLAGAFSATASASTLIADFDGNGVLPVTSGTTVSGFNSTNAAELTFTDASGFDLIAQTQYNFGAFTEPEREAVFTSIGAAGATAAAGATDQAFFLDYSFNETSPDPSATNLISIAFFDSAFTQLSESVSINGTTGGTAVFTLNAADGAAITAAVNNGFFNLEIFSNRPDGGASGTLQIDNFSVGVVSDTVIPEPGTMALFGIGAALVVGGRRRRTAKA